VPRHSKTINTALLAELRIHCTRVN